MPLFTLETKRNPYVLFLTVMVLLSVCFNTSQDSGQWPIQDLTQLCSSSHLPITKQKNYVWMEICDIWPHRHLTPVFKLVVLDTVSAQWLTFIILMQGAQLRKHIDATLGSGNLREAVRLPPGEDINEWLAVNSNFSFFTSPWNMLTMQISFLCWKILLVLTFKALSVLYCTRLCLHASWSTLF